MIKIQQMNKAIQALLVPICFYIGISCVYVSACTGISFKAKDGTIIVARTAEFGIDMQSKIIFIPRGQFYSSKFLAELSGKSWRSKYAMLGMNLFDYPLIIDGFNEKGLAISALHYSGTLNYEKVTSKNARKLISAWELPTWLLSQCEDIQDVKENIKFVRIAATDLQDIEERVPLHFQIYDDSGAGLVLEVFDGTIKASENKAHVLTDAPEFNWHLANLKNYTNISAQTLPGISLEFGIAKTTGLYSGLQGYPGDFSSASRFIKAKGLLALSESALHAEDAIVKGFWILEQFNIPPNMIIELRSPNLKRSYSTTWSSVMDTCNLKYYFQTRFNRAIKYVDLKKFDAQEGSPVQTISIKRSEPFALDISNQALDFSKINETAN